MMIKTSVLSGLSESGPTVAPLLGKSDSAFQSLVERGLLPEVVAFVSDLEPRRDSLNVLVSAVSAVERWGPNINSDGFSEAALKHCPSELWSGVPLYDKPLAMSFPYGFPTFYQARPFAHHRNSDPKKRLGAVTLAAWNDRMKRVELVVRLDRELCERFGGMGIWQRLLSGKHIDVSMGCRVPWDRCSICTDMGAYRRALDSFDPAVHKHPGEAVRIVHKRLRAERGRGIRGIALHRNEYCECMRRSPGKILPDGRQVFVHNDFPAFHDISPVFVGAERVAKVLLFLPSAPEERPPEPPPEVTSTTYVAAVEKTADMQKRVDGRAESDDSADSAASAAVLALSQREPDLPGPVLDELATAPLPNALASATALGIVLKPKEFQRVVLVRHGDALLASALERARCVFPEPSCVRELPLGEAAPGCVALLLPLMESRSFCAPYLSGRLSIPFCRPGDAQSLTTLRRSERLGEIAALYAGYRKALTESVNNPPATSNVCLGTGACAKVAGPFEERLSSAAAAYVERAFLARDDFGG